MTPARVVVVGICGAVDDETPIGAPILPARVVDHATGRQHQHRLIGPGEAHGAPWTTDAITPAADLAALRAQDGGAGHGDRGGRPGPRGAAGT